MRNQPFTTQTNRHVLELISSSLSRFLGINFFHTQHSRRSCVGDCREHNPVADSPARSYYDKHFANHQNIYRLDWSFCRLPGSMKKLHGSARELRRRFKKKNSPRCRRSTAPTTGTMRLWRGTTAGSILLWRWCYRNRLHLLHRVQTYILLPVTRKPVWIFNWLSLPNQPLNVISALKTRWINTDWSMDEGSLVRP